MHLLGTFCFVFLFSVVNGYDACRNGWIRYNESCYLFSTTPVDWADALAICAAFKSQLLEIETAHEDTFIKNHLRSVHDHDSSPPSGYWMGLNDIEVPDDFRWVSSDKTATYVSWYPGQPEGHTHQNCGVLWTPFQFDWGDYFCKDTSLYFICEKGSMVDSGEIIG
ncbi:perlucin-like protein [Mytilus galloprovincialis]|uniref:perlucin-like protein n=1 Tax=Mytilus galloprovincialis TaxID=29158 RepID=UPI003F7BD33F